MNIPLTVKPDKVEINTTSNPACDIKSTASGAGGTLRLNNYAQNNASIGFYNNLDKYWATGMRANNFVIYSNYLTTNESNNAIANDVGIQINQNCYLSLPTIPAYMAISLRVKTSLFMVHLLLSKLYAYSQAQWLLRRVLIFLVDPY